MTRTKIGISANDPSTIDWKARAEAAEKSSTRYFLELERIKKMVPADLVNSACDPHIHVDALVKAHSALAAELDDVRNSIWRLFSPGAWECFCHAGIRGINGKLSGGGHSKACVEMKAILSHPPGKRGKEIVAENAKLREALEEIKRDQGRVCGYFTLCRHAACTSSYTSWAIADAALRELEEK